jgi:hypothetical protein
MQRPSLAVLAVAALAVLAGCGGGGDAGTPTPVYETPLDSDTVLDAHNDAVREAGSFTYVQQVQFAGVIGNQSNRLTATVDLADQRGRIAVNSTIGGVQRIYVTADEGYVQRVGPNETTYQVASEDSRNLAQYVRPSFGTLLSGTDFQYNGTVERDGREVFVYQASGVESADASVLRLQSLTKQNATAFESTVLVRPSGVIEAVDFHAEYETGGQVSIYDVQVRYRGVGATSVSAPDWLEAARNATA